ncbi:MAG: DNA mismatch repair protein MutT, partial [Bifidobacterium sp.]|nr:DNA mismatch repair protein MutT [Bifidobacterium sp.]
MLAHSADAADTHARGQQRRDHLVETVSERLDPQVRERIQTEDDAPTPALMPRHKQAPGPSTFASLDAQELPVV